jgi:hypothetical protein
LNSKNDKHDQQNKREHVKTSQKVLIIAMSTLQQNWRKDQNRFYLEATGGQVEREAAEGKGEK